MSDPQMPGSLPPAMPVPSGSPASTPTPPTPPPGGALRPKPKRRFGWAFWIALMLFFALGLSVLFNFAMLVMLGAQNVAMEERPYQEQRIEGSGDAKIVLIDLHGVIMDISEGGFFGSGESLVGRVQKQLRQAAADPEVKAIVLSVDSPGGGVTASDAIWHEVKDAKAKGKKIVVHMGDVCASGGYYVSAPADHIVASPTTITGSIGVILTHLEYHELFEKHLHIKETAIKSGPHKDILSGAREMSAEERAILQGMIDEMYKRFVDIVIEGRTNREGFPGGDRAAVEKLADGRVYTGQQALDKGLVDSLGYQADALNEARKLTGANDAQIVRYLRQPNFADLFAAKAETKVNVNHGIQIDAAQLLRQATPRLRYLWMPGRGR